MVPCESDAAVTAGIRRWRLAYCGDYGMDLVKLQEGNGKWDFLKIHAGQEGLVEESW